MKKMLIALICLGVVVAFASQPVTDRIRPEKMDPQAQKQMDRARTTPPTYKVTGDYPHFNPDNGRAVLLAEDFESGMPGTWKVVDGNFDGHYWLTGYTSDLLGYDPPGYGTAYAFYSDDDAGSSAPMGNEYLISPAVYTGGAPCMFHYAYGYCNIGSYDRFSVEVQYDYGSGWTGVWDTLVIYTSDLVGVDTFNLAAAESVMVQFVYNEGPYSTWAWACAFDNVYIETPPEHDVGCTEVVDLADGPISPGTYDIKGRIQNFGANAESFYAYAKVWDTDLSVELWSASYYFDPLAVGGNVVHNFGSYTFAEDINFKVEIYTELAGDETPANDKSVIYPRTALGLGDVVFEMDVEAITGDIRLLGVEFDGTYFYLTGAYDFTICYVHVVDLDGNLIASLPQPFWTWGTWGWRDPCDDGENMYASLSPYVDEFHVDLGIPAVVVTNAFPGPLAVCRALAYSSDGPWFYSGDFSDYVYKWKRDWSAGWVNYNSDYWAMYGAAYDTDIDEGGSLWWHSQDDPGTGHLLQIEQMDAASFMFTGLTFGYVPTLQSATGSVAGGMDFYEGFNGWDVLFTMVQGTPDEVVGIFVRNHIPAAAATIDFDPNTLNLSSGGQYIKCFIELEEGYDVNDIDPYSIKITKIEGVAITPPVYGTGKAVIDDNTLMTSFDREEIINALGGIIIPPAYAEVMVVGDVGDYDFAGTGMIRVINPTTKHDGAMGAELPVAFALYETSPNPFSAHTVIRYALPTDAQVKLNIYDASGRKVKALVNGTEAAGYHNVNWDARDDYGRRVSSGVYFVKFEAEDHVQTRKLLLLK